MACQAGPRFYLRAVVVLLVAGTCCAVFSQSCVEAAAGPCAQPRTMSRTDDFVVLPGSELKLNLHQDIQKMSLLALIDGQIQPIPFQIDEINSEGEWILPNHPPYMKGSKVRIDRDDDNGLLDENDELVFMIRDSGDRIQKGFLPEDAEEVDEIMLVVPSDKSRSWVYLCSYASTPPRSDKDYVAYVFPGNRIVTTNYELGFSLKVPISWDYLSFPGGENLIDRMKLRVYLRFFGMKLYFDETDFTSKLSLYKDGPVRVIRRVRSAIYLTKRLRTPSADSESVYYDNAIVIPFRIKIPVSPAIFGKLLKIDTHGGFDMQNMHGWKVKTNADSRWLNIDGKMDEIENKLIDKNVDWFFLAGPREGMINRIVMNKKPDGSPQELPITTDFFYVDRDDVPDPPEFVAGQSPNTGYWLRDTNELRKGLFYFFFIHHIINSACHDGMEERYLRIVDEPIQSFVD